MTSRLTQRLVLFVTLPMTPASSVSERLAAILDKAKRRGEISRKAASWIAPGLFLLVFNTHLVGFALPMPPSRAVRIDAQAYVVIAQANAATAALRSLRANIHSRTTFTYAQPGFNMDGTLIFQRPNLARVDDPRASGFTFVSNGSITNLVDDGGKTYTLPVDWNGDDMTADDESQPFVQYFFRPDFHRLGIDLTEDVDISNQLPGLHFQPIPVVGRSLGTQIWQGAHYQVVEFTRNDTLYGPPAFHNVTTVYVGADHLVHRIIGKMYFSNGIRTDDIWLTDIQTNQLLPHTAFRLPHGGQGKDVL